MEPLISVIVPIYNTDLDYLDFCLSCLKKQSYKNLEIICVDGGSTDSVISIINKYIGDKRFKLFTTYKNVSHQRNVGIDNSNGEYITFIDSDDYINLNFISLLYNAIENTYYNIVIPLTHRCVYSGNSLVSEESYNIHGVEEQIDQNNYFQYARPCELVELRKLYKKSLIGDTRFNECCSYGEDLIFNYELSLKGYKTHFVKDAVYYYRAIKGGNSASRRLNRKGLFIVRYLATLIKNKKKYLSSGALLGLYSEFDRVFNAFYYSLALNKKVLWLIWMIRFKGLFFKRHHNMHDILYLLFPIMIVNKRNRYTIKRLNDKD